MTNRIKSSLTRSERRAVQADFKIVRVNESTWTYQPHDFDGTFESWAESFATRRQAIEAAWAEMQGPIGHNG